MNTWKWTDTTSSSTCVLAAERRALERVDGVPDEHNLLTVFANARNNAVHGVDQYLNSTAKDITVANDAVTFSTANSTLTSQTINLGQSSGNTATLNVQRASGGQVNTGNITVGAPSREYDGAFEYPERRNCVVHRRLLAVASWWRRPSELRDPHRRNDSARRAT